MHARNIGPTGYAALASYFAALVFVIQRVQSTVRQNATDTR